MTDPLHGKTLAAILTELVTHFGWNELGKRIPIKCFTNNASISSSLTFLRKTPWARQKVETLYLSMNGNEIPDKNWKPLSLDEK